MLFPLSRFQLLPYDDKKHKEKHCANYTWGDACDVPSFPRWHKSHKILQWPDKNKEGSRAYEWNYKGNQDANNYACDEKFSEAFLKCALLFMYIFFYNVFYLIEESFDNFLYCWQLILTPSSKKNNPVRGLNIYEIRNLRKPNLCVASCCFECAWGLVI